MEGDEDSDYSILLVYHDTLFYVMKKCLCLTYLFECRRISVLLLVDFIADKLWYLFEDLHNV